MQYEVSGESCEIDLSQLINFSMSFQPLQLLFRDILKRVKETELDNERQDDEIYQLKKALEEMRQRDAEREAQLQELLQQKQGKEEEEAGEAQPGEEGAPPVDLHALWEEVERIKRLMGELQRTGRRRTIEELYAARKRHESGAGASFSDVRRKRSMTPVQPREEGTEEVGDAILCRAREDLMLGDDAKSLPAALEEGAATGETVEPPRRDEAMEQQRQTEEQQQQQSAEGRAGMGEVVPTTSLSRSGEDQSLPFQSDSPMRSERLEWPSTGGAALVGSTGSSVMQSLGQAPFRDINSSICDRLRQDGADIEHLNRVVAEMLNEMKGLHADVDLMRTISSATGDTTQPLPLQRRGTGDVDDLLRRVEALEDAVSSMKKHGGSPSGSTSTVPGVGPASAAAGPGERRESMQNDFRRLRERLDALEQAQERTDGKLGGILAAPTTTSGDTGINPAQVAALAATVDALERQLAALQKLGLRNCDDDLDALREAVERLQRETEALRNTCASLDETKEDKGGRQQPSLSATVGGETLPPPVTNAEDHTAAINDLLRRLGHIQQRMSDAEASVKDLEDQKADRAALQRVCDDLRNLRQLLELGAAKKGDGEALGITAAMQEEMLQKLQQQVSEHMQDFNKSREGTSSDLDALREYVEQIDHRKADASLVANKAERDYVENALERLMREVEQVLNATNAGLIDTLDKSLNVLRDMLDGKATKNDMTQLQRLVSEEHTGSGVPDALMGFKGFRCLGCNRPVETMRPRVMGSRLQPFVNRLPQNHPGGSTTARILQGPAAATDVAPSPPSTA